MMDTDFLFDFTKLNVNFMEQMFSVNYSDELLYMNEIAEKYNNIYKYISEQNKRRK